MFFSVISISRVHGPERDIGRLQGTSTATVLRASSAQRAAGRQMHQNVTTEVI